MKTHTSTIRLIYPQWQGGNVAAMVPEVKDPDDAARGYYLGAQLLDFLAPCGGQETLTVPVSTQIGERRVTDGVLDRDVILRQTKAALEMLRASDPGRIVTLGGDCSVSVVPFTYLAAKYGGDGKQIDIDLKRDGGNIVASVRDYGQGIPEAELPFVKEKFYKGSSKQRGSGIGLAVTEEIVSMHGGTLDIASEVGKGTTVTVTLPSAKSEEALGITGAISKAPETPFTEGEHS